MILIPDGIESDVEVDDVTEEILDVGNDFDFDPNQDVNVGPLQVEENHISDTGNEESGPTQARPTGKSNQQSRYKWTNKHFDLPDVPFKGLFSDPPEDIPTPLQYFKMFLDNECMEYIAKQTNLYAMTKDGKQLGTFAKEIEQFIGILLYTGIFPCRSYCTYWSNFSRFPLIADIMSRNRFQLLFRYIHFNDNTQAKPRDHPDYDPLFKVSPLLKRLRDAMARIEPEERHSVDEQIIPFKGRSGLKQYIKNKPHRWGFKVFARAGISGMIYDFEVYTGKAMKLPGDLSVSANVVLRLVEKLPNDKNFKLYFDNWFSSVDLVFLLKERSIWSVATIRPNRLKGCTLASDNELKRQGRGSLDSKWEKNEHITVVKWYDSKPVHLISSYCSTEPKDKCKRWSVADKQRIDVERPYIVKEYNQHMGGVDLCDMMVELYRTDIRSRRWYLRIVYYCLDVAVQNAWVLYRRHVGQHKQSNYMPLKEFRSNIASALTTAGKIMPQKRGRPSIDDKASCPPKDKRSRVALPVADVRYDSLAHWPQFSQKRMRCKHCPSGYTRILCSKCKVGLCLNDRKNCFMAFHNK